jgi:hypothetical protein
MKFSVGCSLSTKNKNHFKQNPSTKVPSKNVFHERVLFLIE